MTVLWRLAAACWEEAKTRVPCSNTISRWWRYKCRHSFAPLKATWILDGWVRRNSYLDSITHKCN
ncbi:MAG: hypothetical protein JWP75_2869 [Frondihabitans sp.]|nr:hypothetical protein [Frondihabitans sp.]